MLLLLAACRCQTVCPLFAEYHHFTSKFELCVYSAIYTSKMLFTHQTIKIFNLINLLTVVIVINYPFSLEAVECERLLFC